MVLDLGSRLRGKEQKKKGLFADIAQIEVDHPPSYPISDKLFFDKFHFSWAPTLLLSKFEKTTTFYHICYLKTCSNMKNEAKIRENICEIDISLVISPEKGRICLIKKMVWPHLMSKIYLIFFFWICQDHPPTYLGYVCKYTFFFVLTP